MDLLRTMSSALLAEVSKPFFFPVVLVYFDWPGAPIRAHSGVGPITWNGQIWTGVGRFGQISLPEETSGGVTPTEMSMSIYSDYDDIESYTDANVRGRNGSVYIGATTTPGGNVIIGATELFSGKGNGLRFNTTISDNDTGETEIYHGIEVTLKSGQSARTPTTIYHSLEDQQRTYPNDTAGRHLILMEASLSRLLWPEP